MGGRRLTKLSLKRRQKKDPDFQMQRCLESARAAIKHEEFFSNMFAGPRIPESSGKTMRFERYGPRTP